MASPRFADQAARTNSQASMPVDVGPSATDGAKVAAAAAWSLRVRRVGGLIQTAFAALLARARQRGPGRRGFRGPRSGLRRRRDRGLRLRRKGHGRHGAPASEPGGQTDRARSHDRDRDRACRGVHPAGDRERRWALRLGAAVDRDNDRPAAALPRPSRPDPALPASRVGADRRSRDPRRRRCRARR